MPDPGVPAGGEGMGTGDGRGGNPGSDAAGGRWRGPGEASANGRGRGPGEDRAGNPGPDRPGRSPGWGDVIALAAILLGLVFALVIAGRLVPAFGEAFAGFPLTIVVLVVGTVGVLVLAARRGPRDQD